MQGKYRSWPQFAVAYARRQILRRRLARLVAWPERRSLESGCSAVIGMCSRLPALILANLECLARASWPGLREVIVVVDAETGSLSDDLCDRISKGFSPLSVELVFYSAEQARATARLQLPYVYAWLSWAIGMGRATCETVLIHDYDALLLSPPALKSRYEAFRSARGLIQGVRWYKSNSLLESDRLATTFEAFVDLAWLRRFEPIQMFNQVGLLDGRGVDFDILLELQARHAAPDRRAIVPMSSDELLHTSQMIHQYTMFRRHPGAVLPCYSIPMIPFFEFVSGNPAALEEAAKRLRSASSKKVHFLRDETLVNFTLLRDRQVDWILKSMVNGCIRLGIGPNRSLHSYGQELYDLVEVPVERRWRQHFTDAQIGWIERASGANPGGRASDGPGSAAHAGGA